jgi:hypothetical protein
MFALCWERLPEQRPTFTAVYKAFLERGKSECASHGMRDVGALLTGLKAKGARASASAFAAVPKVEWPATMK